ncbi:hypothetical protein BDZ45DRAFT_723718 [Acephala macrosclerotiorum]|nr:hypothetical protein BDZ45DRAFT_723718 [Acephala macrosclerotiorum]
MARIKQTASKNTSGLGNQTRSEQRLNSSRAGRGQTTIESSPETDRDPQSPYFQQGFGTPTSSSSSRSSNMKEKKQKTTGAAGGKKRKVEVVEEEVKYQCECGGGHDTELGCEYAVTLKKHVEISTSIIIGSQAMVTVNVGTETKQAFLVHKELLALHSGYFHDLFSPDIKKEVKKEVKNEPLASFTESTNLYGADSNSEMEDILRDGHATSQTAINPQPTQSVLRLRSPQNPLPGDIKPESSKSGALRELLAAKKSPINTVSHNQKQESYDLPSINPSQFAQFVSFIYTGTIISAFDPLIMAVEHNSVEALWYVGQYLRSPPFQNNILEGLRTTSTVKSGTWPSPEDVEIIYDLHDKAQQSEGDDTKVKGEGEDRGGSKNMLKKFALHCLSASNPLTRHPIATPSGRAWDEFLTKKRTDIGIELLRVSGRWAFTKPWDDKLRGEYMVEEEGLEERWERMILVRRGRAGVRKAAMGGDVGAQLEEGHLKAESEKLGYERWGDSGEDESEERIWRRRGRY